MTITTSNGQEILLTNEDYQRLPTKKLHISKVGYACFWNSGKKIYLHRFIMGFPQGQFVDHINGNKLDNRRENLRIVDKLQSTWNRHYNRIVGVRHVKETKRNKKQWRVRFRVNGKEKWFGRYSTKQEAIEAYNRLIVEYRGEYAVQN